MPELVPQEKTNREPMSRTTGSGIFASAHCEQIDLRYRMARDIVDCGRFFSFFGVEPENEEKSVAVICRTLDPESLDYHIHFRWSASKDALVLYVSFHTGVFSPSEGEREPYAEKFMTWLGGFLVNETAHADLHAEFEYQAGLRRSRFPLPIKLSISPELEAEIGGIDVSFPSMPESISGAQIRQGKKCLTIDLTGTARTNFSTFDIKSEVARLSSLSLRITEAIELQ